MRALLIALALVVTAPASAVADAPLAWQQRAIETAERVWGPQPCGPLRIEWSAPEQFGGTELWGGWAYAGECVIYEPADRIWLGYPDFCTAVLHEAGHVAGRAHSSVGIMRAERQVSRSSGMEGGRRVVRWGDVDRRCLRRGDH